MHCRALVLFASVLLACSSDSSDDETTNANEDSTSTGVDATTSTTGTDTTGPADTSTDEGVKYDIGGGGGTTYLLAVATPADPAAPLQFLAEFVVADAALEITLQPLDADSRQSVGDPLVGDVMFTTPAFSADFDATIPAAANPIGDADLQGTMTLIGSIAGAGTPCGMLDGSLDGLEPAALGGGTWAAVEVSGPGDLPTDFPSACP